MLIKSSYALGDFLQTLKNKKKVFDYAKIEEAGFPIVIMITQRGALGKTFNVKDHIRNMYQKKGDRAIWLMNTKILLEKQKSDFHEDIFKPSIQPLLDPQIPWFWRSTEWGGKIDSNTCRLYHKDDKGKLSPFIDLLALSSSESMKGARVGYKRIVYEEFNVKINQVSKPEDQFNSLLNSMEDVVVNHQKKQDLKIYIFGNSKTLNNPIINKMGIRVLEHEISELRDDYGNPLVLVIAPQLDDKQRQEVEEDNKNNWIYQLQKQSGYHKHSYFNVSLYDDLNRIVQYRAYEDTQKQIKPKLTIFHKDRFIMVYSVYNQSNQLTNKYHVSEIESNEILPNATVALNRRSVRENIVLNKNIKNNFIQALARDLFSFEDITSRDIFIESITT